MQLNRLKQESWGRHGQGKAATQRYASNLLNHLRGPAAKVAWLSYPEIDADPHGRFSMRRARAPTVGNDMGYTPHKTKKQMGVWDRLRRNANRFRPSCPPLPAVVFRGRGRGMQGPEYNRIVNDTIERS